jgi:hypothetical protein
VTQDNDPAKYCDKRLNSQTITQLLKLGPFQPVDKSVLKEYNQRSFLTSWYTIKLPDKTEKIRRWLSYSLTTQKAYCVHCIMFGGPKASDVWTRDGFCDMVHGARDIGIHETSTEHGNSEKAVIRWIRGAQIDKQFGYLSNALVDQNRMVVSCMIDCAKYLATEMTAFQGHSATTEKFCNLFKLLAKHSPATWRKSILKSQNSVLPPIF